MRIGVTGATGFIGGHLLSSLKGRGSIVTLQRQKWLPGRKELKRFVADTDIIFHLGGVNRDTDEHILSGNIASTSRLLEAILNDGKPTTRIIFASSAQVYSWKKYRNPIRETRKTNPDTVYGLSKQTAENLIKNSGIQFVILRMSNVYGPGCRPNYNSVIPTLCYRATKNEPLVIHGDGRQCRDFVYIQDIVQAFMLAGFKPLSGSGNIYNVSSGRLVSLRQIVKQISRIHKNTQVDFLADKKNSEISYSCDSSKFSGQYGWRPRVSLSKGIEETLSYFLGRKRI